ncbi:MAG: hypothetical protein HC915_05980 [Anaerolineae bacterium]|nr:hypothetical protein [Anaerolineae bacterium]
MLPHLQKIDRQKAAMVGVAVAGLCVALYVSDSNIQVSADETTTPDAVPADREFAQELESISLEDFSLERFVSFALAFLGNPLGFNNFTAARLFAVAGLVFFLLNGWVVWRAEGHLKDIIIWLALVAYAGGAAALIALARLDLEDWQQVALFPRYISTALMLWVAVVGVMVLAWGLIRSAGAAAPRWQQGLIYANLVFAALMSFGYFRTNVYGLQFTAMVYDPMDAPYFSLDPNTVCLKNYPAYRVFGCLDGHRIYGEYIPERIFRLGYYGLTVFRDLEPVNLLPSSYAQGSPVILNMPSRWLGLYVQRWLLADVPERAIFHLGPDGERFPTVDIPNAPAHAAENLDAATLEQLGAFIADAEQVWYLSTPERADQDTAFFAMAEAAGYLPTPYPIQDDGYRLARFSIWRFQRAPLAPETIYQFGAEGIALVSWELTGRDNPQACQALRLQSWWTSADVPENNYSLTLVLINAETGQPVLNVDAAPGDTLMQLWEPGQLVFDERLVSLPCDLPAGRYDVLLGMYAQQGGQLVDLTAALPDGAQVGNRAYLTTLNVE